MKFRCDRDALSEALQIVQRGVSSRPGIPALTGVLLEATDEGRLTLTTTDLEVSARLAIDVQVSESGVALVPARLLTDTVKSLSDAPVEFETDRSQAQLRCAAYEGVLRLLPAEDFPGLLEPGGHPRRSQRRRLRRGRGSGGTGRRAGTRHARSSRGSWWRSHVRAACWSPRTRTASRSATSSPPPTARRAPSCRSARCRRRDVPRPPTRRASSRSWWTKRRCRSAPAGSRSPRGSSRVSSPTFGSSCPKATRAAWRSRGSSSSTRCVASGLLARDTTPVRLEFNALGVRLSSSSPDVGSGRRDRGGSLRGRGPDGGVQSRST